MTKTLGERFKAFNAHSLSNLGALSLINDLWKEVQRLEEQVKTLMNQSEGCVITGKVTYPKHPIDCQCTACWKRRSYL
jgi:hypothetical protein